MKSRFLALVSVALLHFVPVVHGQNWTGWHPYAWNNLRLPTNAVGVTVAVWATSHEWSWDNYYGGVPRTMTNKFLSNYYFQHLTNAFVQSWTNWGMSNGTPFRFVVTDTNFMQATNVALQSREIVAFDCYRAVLEREKALADGISTFSSSNDLVVLQAMAGFPKTFRAERDALVWVKNWINSRYARFCRRDWRGTNDTYESWFASNPVTNSGPGAGMSAPTYGSGFDVVGSNLPMNYLTWTPQRSLWCGDEGYYRMMTTKVYHADSGGDSIIVTTMNACGDTVMLTNSWTNGQFVTLICTNSQPWLSAGNDWSNAPSATWGWCGITNLFTLLTDTPSALCNFQALEPYPTYGRYGGLDTANGCYPDTATEIANATTSWDGMFATSNLLWKCDGTTGGIPDRVGVLSIACQSAFGKQFTIAKDGFGFYRASIMRNQSAKVRPLVGGASSNITHRADLYVSAAVSLVPTNETWGSYEYDDGGQGLSRTGQTVFATITEAGNSTNFIVVGDNPDVALPAPDAPTAAPGAGEYVRRGYVADMFWILRWDVPGGFAYW